LAGGSPKFSNKEKTMKRNIVLCAFVMLLGQAAFAGPRFTIYGGGTYSLSSSSGFSNPPTQGNLGYPIAGVAAEFHLGKRFGLVIDGSYFNRSFDTAAFGDVMQSQIQGELLLRYHLIHHISIGVGGYGGYILDPMRRLSGGTVSLAAFGSKNIDYGLTASLNFNIPLSASLAFTAGGKFHYGLSNLASAAGTRLQMSDILFYVGLTFGPTKKK
jgi:hypothetical protein